MRKSIPIPDAAAIRPLAARLAAAGGVLFIVLFAVLHVVRPDLDPSWRAISEYALGPFGWVMTTAFLALAGGCVALFVAISSQVATWPGRIGLLGVLLAALGFLVAAVFPTDPITVPADEMSTTGTIHAIGPVLADGLPLAAGLVGWCLARRNPNWAPVRGRLLAGAILAIGAFLLVTASMVALVPAAGGLGPDAPVGWQTRFMMAAYAGWLVIMGFAALRVRRTAAEQAGATSAGHARVDA